MGAIDECHRPGTRGLLQAIVADVAEPIEGSSEYFADRLYQNGIRAFKFLGDSATW